jgi:hypothetical protein
VGYIIITGIFAATMLLQSVIHHNERQDLYNRIMSNDLGEYQNAGKKRKPGTRKNYLKKNIGDAYRQMYGRDETE